MAGWPALPVLNESNAGPIYRFAANWDNIRWDWKNTVKHWPVQQAAGQAG